MSNLEPASEQLYFDAEKKKKKQQIKCLGLIGTYVRPFFSSATDLKVNISLSSGTQSGLSQVFVQRTKQNHLFN